MEKQFFEFEVDGKKYVMNYYRADVALNLTAKLIAVGIIPLANAVTAFKDKIGKEASIQDLLASDIDLVVIASAFQNLALSLDKIGFSRFVDELFVGLKRYGGNSVEVDWKEDYKGKGGVLIKVLSQVIRGQFASFLDGILASKKDEVEAGVNVQTLQAR